MKTKSALFLGTIAASIVLSNNVFAEELPELKVALAVMDANFNVTTASVYRLAEEMGYFEKHGVNVNYITLDGTPQAVAALNAGEVDLADIGIDAAIRLRAENNVPVKGVMAASIGSAFLIAGKEDITSVEGLKGRSFAIADNGSLDHSLTQAVARGNSVDPAEINFVAIGAPDVRVQALAAGRVDATTVSFGTYSSIAGAPGIHVIVSPDEFSAKAPALSKFVGGLETTLETKREAVQRFTEALIEVSRDMNENPEKWVEAAAAARDDLSRESIEATAELLQSRWCVNGCFEQSNLQGSLDFIYSGPEFAEVAKIELTDLVDMSFTAQAMEKLGVATGEGLDAR